MAPQPQATETTRRGRLPQRSATPNDIGVRPTGASAGAAPPSLLAIVAAVAIAAATTAPSVAAGDAGILYEVWHTKAAQAMAAVAALKLPQLTTELVIRSQYSYPNGSLALDDVYGPAKLNADIYNAQPALGYYCLYRARPGQVAPIPDCPNISTTAEAHARMLTAAGFDYVAVDVTNWPNTDVGGGTDIAVLRPTEVLFEEWAALRARGVSTPQIAVWPCSPSGGNTWKYLLDSLYNNATYEGLVYTQGGKKVVFVPYAGANCFNEATTLLIATNGGRNDVVVVKMWAL